MIWLVIQMWFALVVAFVAGVFVHRWVFGPGSGLSAEDVSAELASIRTRHQEAEAERARLRAQVLELNHQLEEERRRTRSAAADARIAEIAAANPQPTAAKPLKSNGPSPFLTGPTSGEPDDLTKIRGVGAKLAELLNEIGVYYFRQIADWSDEQVAQVDAHLSFPGRIDRDRWREQARELIERTHQH